MQKLCAIMEISGLRLRLDQMNEKIISGLKTRSKYTCNLKTFEEKFSGNKSWILYRLKKEQDIDAEFGRFLFHDQIPFIYSKKQLKKPKLNSIKEFNGVVPVRIDLSKEIIELYKTILVELCPKGENKETYGETTKLDVENLLEINERILGLGEQVAYFKISREPALLDISSKEEIKSKLSVPEREKEVVEKTVLLAQKYELSNIEAIKDFTKKIIDLTRTAEVEFILKAQKNGFRKAFKDKTNGF